VGKNWLIRGVQWLISESVVLGMPAAHSTPPLPGH